MTGVYTFASQKKLIMRIQAASEDAPIRHII
ncbi:hypothetical protein BH10CYA1_BH10CYA1_57590 [soil metagenome]